MSPAKTFKSAMRNVRESWERADPLTVLIHGVGCGVISAILATAWWFGLTVTTPPFRPLVFVFLAAYSLLAALQCLSLIARYPGPRAVTPPSAIPHHEEQS